MSFQAMAWAVEQNCGGPAPKLILMLLANYAGPDGVAFPSIKTLCRESGVKNRATVRRHLQSLKDLKLLNWEGVLDKKGDATSNRYRLALGGGFKIDPPGFKIDPRVGSQSTHHDEPVTCNQSETEPPIVPQGGQMDGGDLPRPHRNESTPENSAAWAAADQAAAEAPTKATQPPSQASLFEDQASQVAHQPGSAEIRNTAVLAVFEHWRRRSDEAFGASPRKLSGKRRGHINGRLDDGFTVQQLTEAIDGCFASDWHVKEGQTDIELILRNDGKVAFFRGKLGSVKPKPRTVYAAPPPTRRESLERIAVMTDLEVERENERRAANGVWTLQQEFPEAFVNRPVEELDEETLALAAEIERRLTPSAA